LASGGSLDGLTVNLSALTQATGTPAAAQALTTNFSTTALIYDSLGGTHTVSFNFSKLATNAWQYTVTIPGADVTGGNSGQPVQLATGTMIFNPTTGLMSSVTESANSGTTQVTGGQINLTSALSLADGATTLNLNWNVLDSTGNAIVTQASATSSAGNQQLDGYASGTLQSISVQSDGTIDGVYSNNQTLPVAQLALASFANQEGLQTVGNGDYQQTTVSGHANIGLAGTASLGTVSGGALEESNVDIAAQFSNLILAQRAYEANAQTVTTFDQVYQTTINLMQGG
jgi:flagellar hook protein FlgE